MCFYVSITFWNLLFLDIDREGANKNAIKDSRLGFLREKEAFCLAL